MSNSLTFLLGSGASFPYGIPMMRGFYIDFRTYIEKRHPHCAALMTSLDARHTTNPPDLESLIADLQHVVGLTEGLSILSHENSSVSSQIELARELRGYLDAFIIDSCERFDREKAARELASLVELSKDSPLWIFTTNYDRIVEFVCESREITWADGFESSAPTAVADWNNRFDGSVRIVKLHGSVNWYEDDPGGALHRLDRGYSLPGYEFRILRGDQRLRPLMIIPTLEKEALGNPYIGLSVRFTDVLADARVLVIVGNSLRDRHIKAFIQQRIDQLRVLLISPSASSNSGILQRPDRTHALDAGISELLTLGGDALRKLQEDVRGAHEDSLVQAAIVRFVDQMAARVSDAMVVSTDPEFQRAWIEVGSPSVTIRVGAIKALSARVHPVARRKLREVLTSDESEHVRVAALDALLHSSGAEAADAIGRALCEDKSLSVQLEAALALTKTELKERGRPWLESRLASADLVPTLRAILSRALGG